MGSKKMMISQVKSASSTSGTVVSTRCPVCRQRATFEPLGTDLELDIEHRVGFVTGQRRCPDPKCRAHLFFIRDKMGPLITYPPERVDFDSTALPPGVQGTLEEAVTCHANRTFVAAAIMVRKTLEELCRDREVSGQDLKERIKALGELAVVPAELFDGLDDLRLLGNDAAHVESRTYDTVGAEEVEIALEFTKEVLKAVYQYSTLLARLRSRKNTE